MPNPLAQLLNPYGTDKDQLVRAQTWISPEDKNFLNSLYPTSGLETLILAGFYKQICQELRNASITFYSPENARLVHQTVLRHLTAILPSGKGPVEDVKGRSDPVRSNPTPSSNESTNLHKEPTGRPGNRTRGRGKK